MPFTTRRSLARVEERKCFVKISCQQNSALFCLFLPLFCLRRFVFLFTFYFNFCCPFFCLFSLQCNFSKATRIE